MDIEKRISARLLELSDEGYRAFQCKLMPTVDPQRVVGVRTPDLRKLAKELMSDDEVYAYFECLPHKTYDENNLHGFMISLIKDYESCVCEVDRLLPFVDNWATCDLLSPLCFKRHHAELLSDIRRWIASEQTYTIRFGIEMLMSHFLDGDFSPDYPELVAAIENDEYYVSMIRAWYFATALAKQQKAIMPYFIEHRLDDATHNRAIRKAIESRRISEALKTELRQYRI